MIHVRYWQSFEYDDDAPRAIIAEQDQLQLRALVMGHAAALLEAWYQAGVYSNWE